MKPTCVICGNEFENTCNSSRELYLKRKYCSRACAGKGTLNARNTPEAHRKQAETQRGVSKSEKHCKNISKGLKNSEKAIATQFKRGKLNPAYGRSQKGQLNSNWKGGITNPNQKLRNDPQMNTWRIQVYQRDNYTCQKCGVKGYLQAHHIIPISQDISKIFDIDNGLTVCVSCHEKIHNRHIGVFKQKN